MERTCSECGDPIRERGANAKTCGDACRQARSRRLKRTRVRNIEKTKYEPHQKIVAEIVNGERDDLLHDIVEEELRPVVRESITEDVLTSIGQLVALTPKAIAALEDDLTSDDPVLRQRAYTLLMKYTVGHNALVESPEDADAKNLNVSFHLPRPGADVESSAEELRECDSCFQHRPLSEFVANSTRCQSCFADARKEAEALIAD